MNWFPFGYEQYVAAKSPLQRLVLRWFGELHFGIRLRGYYLKKVLRNVMDVKSILEVGSNSGQTSFWLRHRFPQASLHGLDIDVSLVEHCQSIAKKLDIRDLDFCAIDILNYCNPRGYDLIICFDVLEHIVNWEMVLRRLVSMLNPGGRLVIHTPYSGHFQSSRFGLRIWFNSSRGNGSPQHVREGFVPNDFALLTSLGVDYTTTCTFGHLAMWLHTFFEIFRGRSWVWHFIFTPALLALSVADNQMNRDGGGLLVQGVKTNVPFSSDLGYIANLAS